MDTADKESSQGYRLEGGDVDEDRSSTSTTYLNTEVCEDYIKKTSDSKKTGGKQNSAEGPSDRNLRRSTIRREYMAQRMRYLFRRV